MPVDETRENNKLVEMTFDMLIGLMYKIERIKNEDRQLEIAEKFFKFVGNFKDVKSAAKILIDMKLNVAEENITDEEEEVALYLE